MDALLVNQTGETTPATGPARPLYLAGADPVFALFHEAPNRCMGGTAVLICPPFGFDDLCSYRSRWAWAQQLAAAGHPTLRIHLPSTGDSAGSSLQAARLPAWSEAVRSAGDWLLAQSGCPLLAAIGIGLGGLVACEAIVAGMAIDSLVLWATPARGRTFLRELRAFGRLYDRQPAVDGAPPIVVADPGTTAAGGFALSTETTAALERLDVGSASFPAGNPRRVLLLERDGISADERLRAAFERAGASVSVAPGQGFNAMMAPPQDAVAPCEVFERVGAWLREDRAGVQAPARVYVVNGRRARHAPPGVAALAVQDGGPPAHLALSVASTPIREIPLQIAQPFGYLFGVLSEPVSPTAGDLCAVLLNAGMIHRIGPGRLGVDIARGWAARGVPALRLDFIGVGDSDDDGRPRHELADLYDPALAAQLKAALDALQARGLGPRFALTGLCAGAYWAFHGALEDQRVTAAFMVNPVRLIWDDLLALRRELRKGLLEPSQWRRLASGELSFERALGFGRSLPRALGTMLASGPSKHRTGNFHRDALERALQQLQREDVYLLLAFSEGEVLHDELAREGRLEGIVARENVELGCLPGHNHTLSPIEAQRRTRELLNRAIEHELRRTAGVRGQARASVAAAPPPSLSPAG